MSLLLCSVLFLLALPAIAKDKHRGSKNQTHHYSPRYISPPRYSPNGHYNPRPAYSPNYRGQSRHRYSNYGNSNHNSIVNQILRRL
ncbi:MAG: hypothetical protein ACYC67_00865 [Prosthecobacter sp.]